MGWSGSLTEQSTLGSSMTLTPDTSVEGRYTVSSFTAPKKGIYQFLLKGSGGTNGSLDASSSGRNGSQTVSGGSGGSTTGYLLLEKGETVYVGCGGTCSAAFVAKTNASGLSSISKSNLYFVAGAGGAAGRAYKNKDEGTATGGGAGGGTSGGASGDGGKGGTQSAGGAAGGSYTGQGSAGSYGTGGAGAYVYVEYLDSYAWGGRGGDGYYGGGSGYAAATHNSMTGYTGSYAYGGGGGSGYVHAATLTYLRKTYASSTNVGGGAGAGSRGSVVVTYYARGLLPVFFDGVQLERLIFNGTETESLVYNGTIIYMRRAMAWLRKHLTRLRWQDALSARRTASLTA